MKYKHTPQCQQAHTRYQVDKARYAARWPGYCHTCGGNGITCYTYDPSPAGVCLSSGWMIDCDPCPDCLERGICPRCGEEAWGDDDFDGEPVTCPHCGWQEDNPDCLPPEPECYCWQVWMQQEQVRIV